MRVMILACLATCTLAITSTSLWAEDSWYQMPSNYYDQVNAKLLGRGYQNIRLVDAEAGLLSAHDANGSEVIITVHERNGAIISEFFVHPSDH